MGLHAFAANNSSEAPAMIDIIIKRDGRKVPFDPQKITDAIMKAFRACNSAKTIKTAEQLTRQVLDELEKNECIGEPVSYTHLDVYKRQIRRQVCLR